MDNEAKKSHHLLYVSWRLRKRSGIIQSKFKGMRTRGADGVSPRAGEEEIRCPNSTVRQKKGANSAFLFFFLYLGL